MIRRYRAIASLASDYPKLEVLVIDDGSADHTAELVREEFRARSARAPPSAIQSRKARGVESRARRSNRRNHRLDRRRHDCGSRSHSSAGPAFRRSKRWRGGRQRESDEPQSLAHALAGARVHHQPESRKARFRFAELHSGRSRRSRCVAHRRASTVTADFQATRSPKIPT